MVLSAPKAVRNPPPLRGACGAWARVRFHVAVGREVTEPSLHSLKQGGPSRPARGMLRVLGPTFRAPASVIHADDAVTAPWSARVHM
eukprot:4805317-Alexandrium_andersonii.AAC.1